MQPRQTLTALLAAMAVFYVAYFAFSTLWPAPPLAAPASSTQPATASAPAETGSATRPASGPAQAEAAPATAPMPLAGEYRIVEGQSREPVRLGGADAQSPYPMLLEISPVGAEVANAWIRGHYETVKKERPYQIFEPVLLPDGSQVGSFSTPDLRFDDRGLTVPLAGRVWELDAAGSTESKKVWTLRIDDAAGRPLARVVKTYELPPQQPDPQTKVSTYDLKLSLQVENLSGGPSRMILVQRGSVGFRKEDQRTDDRVIIAGTWNGATLKAVTHARKPIWKTNGMLSLGKDEEGIRPAWVAEANKYFTCIMTPAGRTGIEGPALFSSVEAVTLLKDETPPTEKPGDMSARFATVPLTVPAGGTASVAFDCYVGPKSKRAFEGVPAYKQRDYYAVMTASYYFCAPAGLTGLMMLLLNFFHGIVPNYGVAIIILVLVVRAILHPITKKSQVSMMKMQKQMARIQPKIEAVKQKYANDRMALNQATMQVYKEEGINPAGNLLTCLPLMLQVPIWGALWQALASTIEMRHAPFDGWWIKDLAGQDALIAFGQTYTIPIVSWLAGPISAFNLLPILLGISQLLQMKYMPRATSPGQAAGPGADQMEQQRKMMMYMSGFFMLMLYNAPSGLNLYIMASNLFGILEQWRIRKHIADLEARKAAEPPPSPVTGPGKRSGEPDKPRKPSWLQRKWEELQKQAAEARKQQGQRGK